MSNKCHWIVGNGSIGCLYDNCEVFDTKQAAIDYLTDLFSDHKGVKTALRKYEIWYDPYPTSLQYCEIVPCDCGTPKIHSDSI